VKAFINVALNSKNFEATKHAIAREFYVSYSDTAKITAAFSKLYPNLNLHCGFALTAMQLEGLILKHVLLNGARAGVLALPIHDAVALELKHADWAKNTMEEAWINVVRDFDKNARTHVKVTR
jgi:hypothetical protein